MEASRNSPGGRDPSPRGAAGRRARWQWRRPASARRPSVRFQIGRRTRPPQPDPATEQTGDTGLANHLSRHAAEEPPFEPAAFGPRHGDEVRAKGFGLDEKLRSRPAEAHQAFYRDAFELRLAHTQVVVGLGQETLHLLI